VRTMFSGTNICPVRAMIRITRRIPRDVHANRSRTILGEINNGLRQLSSYSPGTRGNFARTWFIPDVRLGSIVLSLLALLVTGVAQGAQPQIFYSDIESGPNSGGEGSAGAFVTRHHQTRRHRLCAKRSSPG